jgi:hypothetical protein
MNSFQKEEMNQIVSEKGDSLQYRNSKISESSEMMVCSSEMILNMTSAVLLAALWNAKKVMKFGII